MAIACTDTLMDPLIVRTTLPEPHSLRQIRSASRKLGHAWPVQHSCSVSVLA